MKKLLYFSFVCLLVFLLNLNSVSASNSGGIISGIDTDNDDLIDEAEILFGTSVSNPDSDSDGYEDGTEVSNVFDPNNKSGKLKILASKEEEVIMTGDSIKLLNSFGATKRLLDREKRVVKEIMPGLIKNEKTIKTQVLINFIAYGSGSTYNLSYKVRSKLLEIYCYNKGKYPVTVKNWKDCIDVLKFININKPQQINIKEEMVNNETLQSDKKIISDIEQIGVGLELYFNEIGKYPDSIKAGIMTSHTVYIHTIPSPEIVKNGRCTQKEYIYTSLKNGQDYKLEYCLNNKFENIPAGNNYATPAAYHH